MKRYLCLILISILPLIMASSCGADTTKKNGINGSPVFEAERPPNNVDDHFPTPEGSNKKDEDIHITESAGETGVGESIPEVTAPEKPEKPEQPVEPADTVDVEKKMASYYIDLKLTPEDAYGIFKETYPGASVKEIELEKESRAYVFQVEGYENNMEYELKINPDNGKIIRAKEEKTNKTKGEIKKEDLSKIPALLKESVKSVGEGYMFKEWSAEADNGIIEFTIKFVGNGNKIEYKYNLRTGKLIKIK